MLEKKMKRNGKTEGIKELSAGKKGAENAVYQTAGTIYRLNSSYNPMHGKPEKKHYTGSLC